MAGWDDRFSQWANQDQNQPVTQSNATGVADSIRNKYSGSLDKPAQTQQPQQPIKNGLTMEEVYSMSQEDRDAYRDVMKARFADPNVQKTHYDKPDIVINNSQRKAEQYASSVPNDFYNRHDDRVKDYLDKDTNYQIAQFEKAYTDGTGNTSDYIKYLDNVEGQLKIQGQQIEDRLKNEAAELLRSRGIAPDEERIQSIIDLRKKNDREWIEYSNSVNQLETNRGKIKYSPQMQENELLNQFADLDKVKANSSKALEDFYNMQSTGQYMF